MRYCSRSLLYQILIQTVHGSSYHLVKPVFINRVATVGDDHDPKFLFWMEEHSAVQSICGAGMASKHFAWNELIGMHNGKRITFFFGNSGLHDL